jgi:hypothetical protein
MVSKECIGNSEEGICRGLFEGWNLNPRYPHHEAGILPTLLPLPFRQLFNLLSRIKWGAMDHCCAQLSTNRNVFVMDDSHVRRIGTISPPYSVRIFATWIQNLALYERRNFCNSCSLHNAGDLVWLHLKSVTSTLRNDIQPADQTRYAARLHLEYTSYMCKHGGSKNSLSLPLWRHRVVKEILYESYCTRNGMIH